MKTQENSTASGAGKDDVRKAVPVGAVRFRAMEWIETLEHVSPPQAAVLLYLAHRIDCNGVCRPGRRRIAKATKLHVNTVTRAVKALEAQGQIVVARRRTRTGNWFYGEIRLNAALVMRRGRRSPGTALRFL